MSQSRADQPFKGATRAGLTWGLIGLVSALAGEASAHDTWLNPPDDSARGLLTMTLTTGERFPVQETSMRAENIVASGCLDGRGQLHEFRPRESAQSALVLRTRAGNEPVLACWVRTQVFEVQIEPPLVEVYLKEIQAPASVVQAWEAQRSQGVVWQEAYAKTARIELLRSSKAQGGIAATRVPTGRGLELLPVGDDPVRAGSTLLVQVLLDGRPLAGQAVELVSERNPLGIWRRSDAQGRVQYPVPFTGRWLLRATYLLPPEGPERKWRSQFGTLAVQAR